VQALPRTTEGCVSRQQNSTDTRASAPGRNGDERCERTREAKPTYIGVTQQQPRDNVAHPCSTAVACQTTARR